MCYSICTSFTFRIWWHKVVAVDKDTHYLNTALIPLPQVGVAVHYYLLIGGGGREGSVSRMVDMFTLDMSTTLQDTRAPSAVPY